MGEQNKQPIYAKLAKPDNDEPCTYAIVHIFNTQLAIEFSGPVHEADAIIWIDNWNAHMKRAWAGLDGIGQEQNSVLREWDLLLDEVRVLDILKADVERQRDELLSYVPAGIMITKNNTSGLVRCAERIRQEIKERQ